MTASVPTTPAPLEPPLPAVEAPLNKTPLPDTPAATNTPEAHRVNGSGNGNSQHDGPISPTIASPSFAALQRVTSSDTSAQDTGSDFGDDERDRDRERSSTPDMPSAAALRQRYHRHISRSAAKRDSVAALPSIRDLRLHFGGGLEHRAGLGVGIRSLGATYEEEDEPRLAGGSESPRPIHKPWKDVQLARVGPEQARSEARDLVATVRGKWGLVARTSSSSSSPPPSPTPPPEDVRALLVETARAVRRVRTLALSLVSGQRRVSMPLKGPSPSFMNTPSRPAMPRVVSGGQLVAPIGLPDPSSHVRRAALDLLGQLRTLEERVRVQHDAPMVVIIPSAYEPTLVTSPVDEFPPDCPTSASPGPADRRLSTSSLRPSTSSIEDIFSDDEEWNVNYAAREAEQFEDKPRQAWEERLVAEERAYRPLESGLWAADSAATREAARRWADVVDLAFGERENGNATSVSAWAEGTGPKRTRAFLAANLSPDHAALLPAPSDDDSALLARLSDGYLLVQAYNESLHASSRPWGFINADEMFDTLSSATESGKEWTFRRVQNLTCWAA